MKVRVIIIGYCFLLCLPSVSLAEDTNFYLKPDPLNSTRYTIRDADGNRIGNLQQDPLSSNQIKITDQNGNSTGYLRKDNTSSHSKKYRIYGLDGSFEGEISQDALQPDDKYQIFDKDGRRKGVIKRDTLDDDRWDIDIQ